MKIKILGCGPSYGIPSLTRGFGECNSKNPKNIRYRSSILLSDQGTQVLFDTPPEIRLQLLGVKNRKLDALCYTHLHYDHTGGAEDVKKMVLDQKRGLDVYMSKQDLDYFQEHQSYIFEDKRFSLYQLKFYKPFQVNHLSFVPIKQLHGQLISVGYRVGPFAYSTDLKSIDSKGIQVLKGVDTWVYGSIAHHENDKHTTLNEALELFEKVQPRRVILTHIGTHVDYDKISRKLPKYVCPAYDGMIINIKC